MRPGGLVTPVAGWAAAAAMYSISVELINHPTDYRDADCVAAPGQPSVQSTEGVVDRSYAV